MALHCARPYREAALRVPDGRRGHVLEAHRAPLLEHGERGVKGARHHGGIEAVALQRLSARQVPVDVHRVRRPALADDRGDLGVFLRVHQHQRFAAETVEILLEHAAGEQRGHAGVERIAALQQDAEGRGGGQRMAGGHAARRSHHGGPQRRPGRLAILSRDLRGARVGEGDDEGMPRRGPVHANYLSWSTC